MFPFGKPPPPPPPPPPSLFEGDGGISALLLACVVAIVLCGLLIVRRPDQQRLVAECLLGVAGKASDAAASANEKPMSPQRSPHTTQHLDRAASAKQFVPVRATRPSGTVKLEEDGNACTITYHVSGLAPGLHGFHIHDVGKKKGGPNDRGR